MRSSNFQYLIRPVELLDASSKVQLDQRLAEDGRGMVLAISQVSTVQEERSRIKATLENSVGNLELVAALDNGQIIGNARVDQFRPALCQHVGLLTLGVDPKFQGKGVGQALLQSMLEQINSTVLLRLELYVREDNTRAIQLYKKMGFHKEAVRTNFIRLPNGDFINDLIMVKFLTGIME